MKIDSKQTNKPTKEGKLKQTIQGENNIFYKSITISSQYLNNPILEHELKLIILEKWHVIDKNGCRTYSQNVQVLSKKKQQQRHTNKQGKRID